MHKIVVPGGAAACLIAVLLVLHPVGARPGSDSVASADQGRMAEKIEPGHCRKVCFEGVCSERCVGQPDNEGFMERRVYRRDRWRDRDRYRDDDLGPSFRFEKR